MKITGTRGYITIEYDHRALKVSGELTTTPAFYANIDSIKNWEPPYENIVITDAEKEDIIKQATEQDGAVKIFFD